MGGSWFRKKLVDIFRLSEKLTTEFPNEASGFLPEPGKKEWSIATPHVLGLGYNTLTTSLQMLSAYATFANGGYQVTPFLVPRKEKVIRFNYVFGPRQFGVRSSSYQIRADLCRKLALNPSKKVLHDETISTITEAMKFVTKSGGTSKLAELGSYTEVGKSGTAEKFIDGKYSKTRNVASFIGFAPFSHPRFVLIVSLDEPIRKWTPYGWHQYGGVSSAPIFRNIANRVLKYFGVPVESPEISELFKLRVQEQKAMYEKMKC
jgi:cell division protein FtsI (penicillin-binding protein 3)